MPARRQALGDDVEEVHVAEVVRGDRNDQVERSIPSIVDVAHEQVRSTIGLRGDVRNVGASGHQPFDILVRREAILLHATARNGTLRPARAPCLGMRSKTAVFRTEFALKTREVEIFLL